MARGAACELFMTRFYQEQKSFSGKLLSAEFCLRRSAFAGFSSLAGDLNFWNSPPCRTSSVAIAAKHQQLSPL